MIKSAKLLLNHFYKPYFPLEVILYITNKCNLRCRFCEIGASDRIGNPGIELTPPQIDKIVASMAKMKVRNIYITGGEPFVARNIWYLLSECGKNSISIDGITTNGSFLSKWTPQQIDILNRANVRKIIISVDHANMNKHDELRQRNGLFKEIDTFLRSEGTIKTAYCISTVISRENYKDICNLIEWASITKRIRHINFQPICVESIFVDYEAAATKKSFWIDVSQLQELEDMIDRALWVAKKLQMSTSLPVLKKWIKEYFTYAESDTFFFHKVMAGFICSKPYNYLHINYNGDLLACTHIGPIGNIADGDISKLWRDAALKFKKSDESGHYSDKCKNCFCDFPANFRNAMIYRPIRNLEQILQLAPYYIHRYIHNK